LGKSFNFVVENNNIVTNSLALSASTGTNNSTYEFENDIYQNETLVRKKVCPQALKNCRKPTHFIDITATNTLLLFVAVK